MYYGAAQGKQHFAFLTVGTGVGVGLVLNGGVYHGKCNYAGEIGHVGIDFDGARCKCGGWGCLENIASGPGMVELMKAELAKGRPSVLELCHTNSAQEIFAASNGILCVEIVEQAARALGYVKPKQPIGSRTGSSRRYSRRCPRCSSIICKAIWR